MDDSFFGKPRKTTVTYGKAKRRPVTSFKDFGLEESPKKKADVVRSKDVQAQTSQPNMSSPEAETPAIRQTSIFSRGHTPKKAASTRPMKRIAPSIPTKTNTSSVQSQFPQSKPVHKVRSSKPSPTVYDVPSSDEDYHTSTTTASAKKRRKITPIARRNIYKTFDDDAFQQDIAAQSGNFTESPTLSAMGVMDLQDRELCDSSENIRGKPLPARRDRTTKPSPKSAKQNLKKSGAVSTSEATFRSALGGRGKANAHVHTQKAEEVDLGQAMQLDESECSSSNLESPKTPVSTPGSDIRSVPTSSRDISSAGSPLIEEQTRNVIRGSGGPLSGGDSTPSSSKASPGRLGLEKLTLSLNKPPGVATAQKQQKPIQFPSLVTAASLQSKGPRKRLIDTLGPSEAEPVSPLEEAENVIGMEAPIDQPQINGPHSPRVEENHVSAHISLQADKSSSSQSLTQTSQPSVPRITYGPQRSYLTEDFLNVDMPLASPTTNSRRTQRSIKHPLTTHDSLRTLTNDIDEDDIGGSGGIRSIYELRQAGGNARFLTENEAIFEDLEDSGPGHLARQRSGLMDLWRKLDDAEYARRFIESGLELRLSQLFLKQNDTLTYFLLSCAYALLLCSDLPTERVYEACKHGAINAFNLCLSEERDLPIMIKDRKLNMSKAAKANFQEFIPIMRNSRMFGERKPRTMNCQIIGLRCLELTVGRLRRSIDLAEVLPADSVITWIDVLISHLPARLNPDSNSNDDILVTELTLSILEPSIVGLDTDSERASTLVKALSSICGSDEAEAGPLQFTGLQLTVNATNHNPAMCETFATDELVGAICRLVISKFAEIEDQETLNIVVLALGSLINFAEHSDTARSMIYELPNGSPSYLDDLLSMFLGGLDDISQVRFP